MSEKYVIHPYAKLFRPMNAEEIAGLDESLERGYDKNQPIWYVPGKNGVREIIDGRSREERCKVKKITPVYAEVKLKKGETLRDRVISLNLHRRHLSDADRTKLAAKLVREGAFKED